MHHFHSFRSVLSILLCCVLLIAATGCTTQAENPPSTTSATHPTFPPVETPTEPSTQPTVGEIVPEPEPEPTPTYYTLSFAGDCTLGTDYDVYGMPHTFVGMVGDNYSYPFEHTLPYFENDDFTLINLEGTFTDSTEHRDKIYCFRGPYTYSKILTAGSIEAVSFANNHAQDFGETGYQDTKSSLEAEGITYVEQWKTALYTTKSGLTIGLYADMQPNNKSHMQQQIAQLREAGAEIVIASFHWGFELWYQPTAEQVDFGHAAIDAGADIVFGHHPHVLQPIEEYNGGVIYYSLGNFSFGGNRNPKDKDSVVIQQTVIRDVDGTIRLGDTTAIPFCVSEYPDYNNYKPIPYEVGSEAYERTLQKLNVTATKEDAQN